MATRSPRAILATLLLSTAAVSVVGCDYFRLLRPKVLKQLKPRVVALVDAATGKVTARLTPTREGVDVCPAASGAKEWPHAAYSPAHRLALRPGDRGVRQLQHAPGAGG